MRWRVARPSQCKQERTVVSQNKLPSGRPPHSTYLAHCRHDRQARARNHARSDQPPGVSYMLNERATNRGKEKIAWLTSALASVLASERAKKNATSTVRVAYGRRGPRSLFRERRFFSSGYHSTGIQYFWLHSKLRKKQSWRSGAYATHFVTYSFM